MPRWPRKTVVTYWLQHNPEPEPHIHIDTYPIWALVVDAILSHHPHWDWWDRLWARVSPYYGDPLCYVYCAKWSLDNHSLRHVNTSTKFEFLPPKERAWMEESIREAQEEER